MTATHKLRASHFRRSRLLVIVAVLGAASNAGILLVVRRARGDVLGRLRRTRCVQSVGYAPATYTTGYAPAYTTAYAPAYTTAYRSDLRRRLVSGPLCRSREPRDLGLSDNDLLRADLHRGVSPTYTAAYATSAYYAAPSMQHLSCGLRATRVQLVLGKLRTRPVQHV